MRNLFTVDFGKDVANAGAGVRANDLADQVIADIFPEARGRWPCRSRKGWSLRADTLVVFGGG